MSEAAHHKPGIYQLLAGGASENAVVAEALAFENAFRRWAFKTRIYAADIHPSLAGRVAPLARCKPAPDDILILHLTAHSPAMDFALRAASRLVVIYHNFTPPRYLRGLGGNLAARMEAGRSGLTALRERAALALADSAYSEQELKQAGFARTGVLPVLVPDELQRAQPDEGVTARHGSRNRESGVVTLLFVGRIVPNKCVEDVIKVFDCYRQLNPAARLFVVGSDANSRPYADWLGRLVSWLRLEGVHFTGEVSRAELAAYYRLADVYVSMSEHEGFGVPLVESMRFEIPVLAYAATAVPETLGGSGVLMRRKDFAMAAGMVHLLQTEPALRSGVVARQNEWVRRYEPNLILQQLRDYLQPFLAGPRQP